MMNTRFAAVASAIALLSLAGCASQSQTARSLLADSAVGGQQIVWDYEQDFLLDERQAAALKAIPKGVPLETATKIVEVISEGEGMAGRQPSSYPVALSCAKPALTVVTTVALSASYVKQGCVVARKV